MRFVWQSVVVVPLVAILSTSHGTLAESEELPPTPADVAALEEAFFAPQLTADEVRVLLETLSNADVRAAAEAELAAKGHGHEELIAEFAAASPDLEVREACAAIVAALDSRWRETEAGRKLGEAYRRHGEALLPDTWAAFRKDPLDQRAVAVLIALEPQAVGGWLSQRNDKLDSLRYLLLRIREASPDEFAQAHLFEHDGASVAKVLLDVFPHSLPGAHHAAKRIVGHTAFGAIELHLDESKSPATLASVELTNQQLYLFEHDWHREPGAFSTGFESCTYTRGEKKIATRPVVRANEPVEEDAASVPAKNHLPLLHLEQYHFIGAKANHLPLPWWVDTYLPARWRDKVGERTVRFRGEQPPWIVPPAPPERTAEEEAAVTLAEWRPFVEPEAFTPEEQAERQKLADAQIERGRSIVVEKSELRTSERRLQALSHLEAAVRVAPDYEPAAYEHCRMLQEICSGERSRDPKYAELLHRLGWASADYLLRFDEIAARRVEVSQFAHSIYGLREFAQWPRRSGYHAGLSPSAIERRVAPMPGFKLNAEEFHLLEGCRRIAEASFRVPLEDAPHVAMATMLAYRGMRAKDIPLERRQAWLDRIVVAADRQLAQANGEKLSTPAVVVKVKDLLNVRANAAFLAVDEGNPTRAVELIRELLPRIPYSIQHDGGTDSFSTILFDLKGAVDSGTRSTHENWTMSRKGVLQLLQLPSAIARIEYAKVSLPDRPVVRHKASGLRWESKFTPVAATKSGLYVTIFNDSPNTSNPFRNPKLALLPLDHDGKPKGKQVPLDAEDLTMVWDTLRILPQPPQGIRQGTAVALPGGRLGVGHFTDSLSIFDFKRETWRNIEVGKRRIASVFSLFPLDRQRLFCAGVAFDGAGRFVGVHTLVDVESGDAEVLRRFALQPPTDFDTELSAVWEHRGRLTGLGAGGFTVDLLGENPERIAIPATGIHGGAPVGRSHDHPRPTAISVGDSLYVNAWGTLHECEPTGKIRRSWPGRSYSRPAMPLLGGSAFAVGMEGTLPIRGDIASVGPLLLSTGPSTDLIAFDPQTETLYGPFEIPARHFLSVEDGVWISGFGNGIWASSADSGSGLIRVTADELIAAAAKAGAVTTLAEHAKRAEIALSTLSPIPRAMKFFAIGRLKEARELVEAELALPPDPKRTRHPELELQKRHESEALFLLACLCGPDALDDAPKLLECTAKLAAAKDGDSASLTWFDRTRIVTGMYLEFRLHRRNEDWPKTQAAAERILGRFPYIADDLRNEVNAGYEESRKRLDRTRGDRTSPPIDPPESRS